MPKVLTRLCRNSLFALCVFALLAGGGLAVHAQTVVREGLQIGAMGPLRVALPQVQSKFGLEYDVRNFRDSTAALLALEQGDVDIVNTTSQHLVRAIDEGIDAVWIAGWGGGYNVLVASKTFNVSPNDPTALKAAILKRKKAGSPVKIGVPTGSMQHAKLLQYLKSIGVDAAHDTDIINIPFPSQPRALQAGEVDMAMTLSGFGALAIEKGDAKLVKHIFGGIAGKQEIGFLVMRKLIKEKPDLVQKIVSSHVAAMKMFLGNPDKQYALAVKYSKLPPKVIAMEEHDFLHYDYRTSVADLKEMAEEMKKLGWSKHDDVSKVANHVDLNFLAKATNEPVKALDHW